MYESANAMFVICTNPKLYRYLLSYLLSMSVITTRKTIQSLTFFQPFKTVMTREFYSAFSYIPDASLLLPP